MPTPAPAKPMSKRPRGGLWTPIALLCWLGVLIGVPAVAIAHLVPGEITEQGDLGQQVFYGAFMLRTFTFHAGLALLFAVLVALLSRRRRLLLCSALPALAFTAPALLTYVPGDQPAATGAPLRIASFNLFHGNEDTAAVLAEIDRLDPDVIAFQEYGPIWDQPLFTALHEEYPYILRVEETEPGGQGLYSKRPLTNTRLLDRSHGYRWPLISAEIEHEGRTLRLWNVHLSSPFSAMKVAWNWSESVMLAESILQDRVSTIVIGDMNATPGAASITHLRSRAGLGDAHAEGGRGRGATWSDHPPVKYFPGVRIDQVLITPDLVCTASEVGRSVGSDHRPIYVDARWAAKP